MYRPIDFPKVPPIDEFRPTVCTRESTATTTIEDEIQIPHLRPQNINSIRKGSVIGFLKDVDNVGTHV